MCDVCTGLSALGPSSFLRPNPSSAFSLLPNTKILTSAVGADLITKLDFGQFRYFWWDVMRPCSLQDGENCLTCTAINNLSDSLETRLTSRISPVSFHATCPSPPMGPVTRYKGMSLWLFRQCCRRQFEDYMFCIIR